MTASRVLVTTTVSCEIHALVLKNCRVYMTNIV